MDKPEYLCKYLQELSNPEVQREFLLDGRSIYMFRKIVGMEHQKGHCLHWVVGWRDDESTELVGINSLMEIFILHADV